MKTALLFSGQGSQYVGMMRDLAGTYEAARRRIAQADEILGYSLSTICFEGPAETLKETRYTQPALFVHEAVLVDLLGANLSFDAVAGHSLGEYSALYAASVLSFEDALRLVALRGELMFGAGEERPGTMLAIIGLEDAKVEELCRQISGEGLVAVPANYNCPGQLVVSGSRDLLRSHMDSFKSAGARMVMELPVSGAFHSPLMEPAKEKLSERIRETVFHDATKVIYSNVSATPMTGSDEIRQALIQQLVSPVRWTQIMNAMNEAGISRYIEIGPGKVLQGLVKRTIRDASISGIDTASDLENYFSTANATS